MKMAPVAMQKEVMRLAQEAGGVLKPAALVRSAEPADSPIHGWFEWDDGAAAQAWRIEQARQLIQVTVTTIEKPKAEPVTVRALVSLPRDRTEGGYRLTTAVLGDAELREEMLADALDELHRIKTKYATLRELAPVFTVIDTTTEQYAKTRRTV